MNVINQHFGLSAKYFDLNQRANLSCDLMLYFEDTSENDAEDNITV